MKTECVFHIVYDFSQLQEHIRHLQLSKVFGIDTEKDPFEVVIDFSHTHVWDHASVVGIQSVVEKYDVLRKSVSLVGIMTKAWN